MLAEVQNWDLRDHRQQTTRLVVELWLHRVADDLSGLTFQEWDPSTGSDDTSAPVAILVNSSELLGNSTFVLSVENDNDFRSRCE